MIKALEWVQNPHDVDLQTAQTVVGSYDVWTSINGKWVVTFPGGSRSPVGDFNTSDEAKEFAQRQFERRVATLLTVTPPKGFKFLPEDLETHLGAFEKACLIAKNESWGDDLTYWEHQLKTIAQIKEQLK